MLQSTALSCGTILAGDVTTSCDQPLVSIRRIAMRGIIPGRRAWVRSHIMHSLYWYCFLARSMLAFLEDSSSILVHDQQLYIGRPSNNSVRPNTYTCQNLERLGSARCTRQCRKYGCPVLELHCNQKQHLQHLRCWMYRLIYALGAVVHIATLPVRL